MTIKDIQTEVVEAVVAYAQAEDDAAASRAQSQRARTLAMAGPANLKGMRGRGARARVPGKRIKSVHRRSSRGVPLKPWAAQAAAVADDVRAWRENKKSPPGKPRLKLIKAPKPVEAPGPNSGKGGKGGK